MQAFADAAAAGEEEALWSYIGKFGKEAIDLPCPKTGYSALMRAAQHGRTGLCAKLLDKGADPDWQDKDGWTPLRAAVSMGRSAGRERIAALLDRASAEMTMAEVSATAAATRAAIDTAARGIEQDMRGGLSQPVVVSGPLHFKS